jgi:hemolysin III
MWHGSYKLRLQHEHSQSDRVRGLIRRVARWCRAWSEIGPEEIVNTLTHGIGIPLALTGLVVLVWRSLHYADVGHTVAVVVYGLTLLAAYLASTLYHGARSPRVKNIFLWLDHSCVYALIAGTYTPFMLTVLRGALGTTLLIAVWALGVTGVLAKTVLKIRSDAISIPFYIVMGWLIVVAIQPFTTLMATSGVVLLGLGGLCYMVGIAFFLLRMRYAHAAWHLLVLAGSGLHYTSVLLYARPA